MKLKDKFSNIWGFGVLGFWGFAPHTSAPHPHTPLTMNRRASTLTTLCGQLVPTFLCAPRPEWFLVLFLRHLRHPSFPSKRYRPFVVPLHSLHHDGGTRCPDTLGRQSNERPPVCEDGLHDALRTPGELVTDARRRARPSPIG